MSPSVISGLRIDLARAEDASVIADLIRRAFQSQAELYDVDDLPPLNETEESILEAMSANVVLKAVHEDSIVGSVKGELKDGICHIGRLVVEPELQGQGIGRALTAALEERFPDVQRFEIFTGHLSDTALGLYESLGYVRYETKVVHDNVTLVYLKKSVPRN